MPRSFVPITEIDQEAYARLSYASYYLREAKLVYVETPKAACSAFKHSIASLGGHDLERSFCSASAEKTNLMTIHDRQKMDFPSLCELDANEIKIVLEREDVMRFCVVRNPFYRLASSWCDRFLLHSLSPEAPILSYAGFPKYKANWPYLRECFAQFVDYLYRFERSKQSNHHWQCLDTLLLPQVVGYNHVVKVENLKRDLAPLISHIERQKLTWPGLAKINETPLRLGASLYTANTAKRVAEIYARDFEDYEYSDKLDIPITHGSDNLPDETWVRNIQLRNERIFFLSKTLRAKPNN